MFWESIGNIANITGVVSFVPLIIAATKYITSDRRKKKERIVSLRNANGCKSVALIISLGNISIRTDVEKYLINDANFSKEFPSLVNNPKKEKDTGVTEIHIDKSMPDTTEKAMDYVSEIIKKYKDIEPKFKNSGVDRVHLFYLGPSIVLAPIAAELANRFTVVCHQWDKKKGYYSIGFMQND